MVNYTGNLFKYKLIAAGVDFSSDVFKARLMTTGFSFNRATHTKWADISASELANANGYTTGGVTLGGVALAQDNVNHRATVNWTNPQWTASGGNIGPISGCVVIDDTDSDDLIVLYIPFSPEMTQANGGTFTVAGVEYDQVDTITPA